MQYVIVEYSADRTVNVDGEDNGQTNNIMYVDEGTHSFDLGDPLDYEPASQDVTINNTSALNPQKVTFTPKA